MTDKEIINALNNCICTGNCDYCHFFDIDISRCSSMLFESVLAIINRQQAEIEICAEVIERQDKEIEELNEFSNERLDKFTERYDRNLKAEAIRDFAERLSNYKEYRYNENCDFVPYVRLSDIEKVVYEMVGTENET